MPTKITKKGIFCLEGLWNHHDIKDKSTVLPILDLLEKRNTCDYIYHDCATKHELEFYLEKWTRLSVSNKFPILYFAFHGEKGSIAFTHKNKYTLDQLGDFLEGKCFGKVIYFGSCSTLKIDKRKIQNFLEKTCAIAAIGYKTDIDWIQSTACDLFVFEALQQDNLDSKGIDNIHKKIISNYGNLHRILDLSVVINDSVHIPRKRK
jgi:hypothetical protein